MQDGTNLKNQQSMIELFIFPLVNGGLFLAKGGIVESQFSVLCIFFLDFCFSASLLFLAFPCFCFSASLLFLAFPCFCFYASLLLCFSTVLLLFFAFLRFFLSLLLCFSASLLFYFFASLLLHCSVSPLLSVFFFFKPK